jgi:hypothetical protein
MRKMTVVLALFFSCWLLPQTNAQQTPAEQKAQEQPAPEQFSDGDMDKVLRDMREGLEGHTSRRFLSVFADKQMDGYLSFHEQIEQFFEQYDDFRIHYRIIQSSAEGTKGVALVELQMEAIPRIGSGAPLRRDQQIRFELERGKKGWKVVDFRPRDFFTP